MRGFVGFLCALCLLFSLTGCGREEAVVPEPPPAPPVAEEPEPITAPKPAPEYHPNPTLMPGDAVTVDGQPVDGSVILGDVCCVPLDGLADALDTELYGHAFRWDGHTASVDGDAFYVDGQAYDLPVRSVSVGETFYVPVEPICDALDMSRFDDAEQNHLYFTPEAGDWTVPAGYSVTTFMYHAVEEETWGYSDLFVRPTELEAQLQYLQDNGYTTIHFSDLAHVDEIEKPVLLTFDDGYVDNYTELFPLLEKYSAKATIFVITGSIGRNPHYMTAEQVKALSDSDLVEIQGHTVSHPNLDELPVQEQERQLTQCKLDLIRMTGREPYVFSYPSGRYTWDTLELVKKHYRFAVRMDGSQLLTGSNDYEIGRWYVPRYLDIYSFGSMAKGY